MIESRIESDLSGTTVAPQSRIEQILNGETVIPKSRIEELLIGYNPEDPGDYHKVECTKAQYEAMSSHDSSTIYVVTYPDETVHFYLGDNEISGSTPTLIEKTITVNGIYDPSDESADGYSAVTVSVPATFMLTPDVVNATANFGGRGGKVAENLAITDEETLNTRMSGGWDSAYAATYDTEYQIGAFGGYKWDTPFVLSSAKLWIGKYVQQNKTLIVTVQVRNANDEWTDVQDFNVSADIPYPINVFECQLPSTPIYGVRWIHKKEPQKTSANTITFFGMKVYV